MIPVKLKQVDKIYKITLKDNISTDDFVVKLVSDNYRYYYKNTEKYLTDTEWKVFLKILANTEYPAVEIDDEANAKDYYTYEDIQIPALAFKKESYQPKFKGHYDFSKTGNYFVMKASSHEDMTILVNEAELHGYCLMTSNPIDRIIEMRKGSSAGF